MTTYELWDFETGNAIGDYASETEALGVVRENVRARGPSVIHGIALLAVDAAGESQLVAQGEDLLKRVLMEDSAAS